MASIYKRSQDKKKRGSCWYIGFIDHRGKRKTRKGFSDRQATERLAASLEEEARLIRCGQQAAPDGLADRLDLLVNAFEQHLKDRDVSKNQWTELTRKIRRIISECEFGSVESIKGSGIESFLSECRQKGLSKQSSNHYVKAIRQFCRWLVRHNRLTRDPTSDIPLLNVQTDRRHDRAA